MAEPRAVLFCEDLGHESFVRALLRRLRQDEHLSVNLEVRSSRGGLGRGVAELRAWQRAVRAQGGLPDLLLVLLDANSDGPATRRRQIQEVLDPSLFPRVAVGTPDPYIERWYFADEEAFQIVAGVRPPGTRELKSNRLAWKAALRRAIDDAGGFLLNDIADLAPEILERMDLYAAAKAEPTLNQFLSELRSALRSLQV